jgi:hypothetical protein
MKRLIIRLFLQGFVYLLAVVIILSAVKILSAGKGNALFVFLGNMMVYMMTMGIIFIVEQYEDKHKGYALLSSLPVKMREVLALKFALVLFYLALYVGFLVILAKIYVSGRNFALVRSLTLFNGTLGLILAGLFFIGIFGLGYTKFTIIFLSFTVALGFVPMAIQMFADLDRLIEQFKSFLRMLPWIWVLPLAILLYAALFFLAAEVMKRHSI